MVRLRVLQIVEPEVCPVCGGVLEREEGEEEGGNKVYSIYHLFKLII